MRIHLLDALLPRTRQRILAATTLQPDRWWYMADLARHLELRPSSLQRELPALVAAGILRDRRDGRQVYYQPDPRCPILPDLQALLLKTVGLVDLLRDALVPLRKRIRVAFVYGSLARGDEIATSDVDLMIVGSVALADVSRILPEAERTLAREVNPTVYAPDEFAGKLESGHHFLREVLSGPKLLIVGSIDDLEGLARETTRAEASDQSRRARRPPKSRRPGSS